MTTKEDIIKLQNKLSKARSQGYHELIHSDLAAGLSVAAGLAVLGVGVISNVLYYAGAVPVLAAFYPALATQLFGVGGLGFMLLMLVHDHFEDYYKLRRKLKEEKAKIRRIAKAEPGSLSTPEAAGGELNTP